MSNWKLPRWQEQVTVNGTTYIASGGVFAVAAGDDAEMAKIGAIPDSGVSAAADVRVAASANAATLAQQTWAGLATATSTQIADKTHAINTSGKVKGKHVYDTVQDLIYFAIGTSATSKWRLTGAVDATGDVTPS